MAFPVEGNVFSRGLLICSIVLLSACSETHIRSYDDQKFTANSGVFLTVVKDHAASPGEEVIGLDFESTETGKKFHLWRSACTQKYFGILGSMTRKPENDQISGDGVCGNFLVGELPPGKYNPTRISINDNDVSGRSNAYANYNILGISFDVKAGEMTYLGRIIVNSQNRTLGGKLLETEVSTKDEFETDMVFLDKSYPNLSHLHRSRQVIHLPLRKFVR